MFNHYHVDLYLPSMKGQTQKKIFQDLAEALSAHCVAPAPILEKVFDKRLSERTFGMEAGVAVFDVQSSLVKRPALVIASFESRVDFNALDGNPVDVMAAVVSPSGEAGRHLQKLSWVSRLLKNEVLCCGLRSARDEDAMRVLFLPDQEWMMAA